MFVMLMLHPLSLIDGVTFYCINRDSNGSMLIAL